MSGATFTMEIVTEQIKLVNPELADAAQLFALRTHPAVNKFIDRDLPENVAEVEKFIETVRQKGHYVLIKTLPREEFAGAICLWNIDRDAHDAELGYELLPEYQGRGIMKQAVLTIIHFAFTTLQLQTLEAFTHQDNVRSRKLLERCNFKLMEGKTDPHNRNNVIYCLNKTD